MSQIPLYVVCGKAGSGKNSFGDRAAARVGGVTIGLADPMKRMMGRLFGFNDTQLFGPSEERNKVDARLNSADLNSAFGPASMLANLGKNWIRQLNMDADPEEALRALHIWYDTCVARAAVDGGLSPRFALQTFGTEWGRTLDPEVWSKEAIKTGRRLLGGEHLYDCRVGLTRMPTMKRPPNAVYITDGRFANEIVNVKSAGGFAIEIRREGGADTTTTGVAGHSSEAGLDEVPAHFYDFRLTNNGTLEELLAAADRFAHTTTLPCARISTHSFALAGVA